MEVLLNQDSDTGPSWSSCIDLGSELKLTVKQVYIPRFSVEKNTFIFIIDIKTFNPFPHIDAFWCRCSRRLFENIMTKEEIAQNLQFLRLPQCFSLFVIHSIMEIFYVLTKYVQSRLLQNCRMREWVKLINIWFLYWFLLPKMGVKSCLSQG